MKRVLAAVLLGMGMLLTQVGPVPAAHAATAPTSPRPPARRMSAPVYVGQVVLRTNLARENHGKRAIRVQNCLTRKAVARATWMAEHNDMVHLPLSNVLRGCGMDFVGENIAYGFRTGRATVRAWMKSPGHRANILDGHFRRIGVAAVRSRSGYWYVSQVFGRRA